MRDVTAAFNAIERKSAKMRLAVNEGKTKYMLLTIGDMPRMWAQITANSYNFDVVKEFIYLRTAINTNNGVSRDLSRATKLTLYKALILPLLFYSAEAWTLSSTDAAALRVFVRKCYARVLVQ